jgi:hypothetical protein
MTTGPWPAAIWWHPPAGPYGHDCAARYPLIVEAVKHLRVRSLLVVWCDDHGVMHVATITGKFHFLR